MHRRGTDGCKMHTLNFYVGKKKFCLSMSLFYRDTWEKIAAADRKDEKMTFHSGFEQSTGGRRGEKLSERKRKKLTSLFYLSTKVQQSCLVPQLHHAAFDDIIRIVRIRKHNREGLPYSQYLCSTCWWISNTTIQDFQENELLHIWALHRGSLIFKMSPCLFSHNHSGTF